MRARRGNRQDRKAQCTMFCSQRHVSIKLWCSCQWFEDLSSFQVSACKTRLVLLWKIILFLPVLPWRRRTPRCIHRAPPPVLSGVSLCLQKAIKKSSSRHNVALTNIIYYTRRPGVSPHMTLCTAGANVVQFDVTGINTVTANTTFSKVFKGKKSSCPSRQRWW